MTTKGAMDLGRSKDYQPEQPIYYSHTVHAGVNQINCQYCHTGTYQGKQATLPSVNVCMNCHMAINEYKGAPLVRENGDVVDGTAEIKNYTNTQDLRKGNLGMQRMQNLLSGCVYIIYLITFTLTTHNT